MIASLLNWPLWLLKTPSGFENDPWGFLRNQILHGVVFGVVPAFLGVDPLIIALAYGFLIEVTQITFFKGEGFARHLEIGRAFMGLIFETGTLSCLMALTPAAIRHSWKFGLDLGFTRLGTIPGACGVLDRKKGTIRYRDGMLMKLDNPKPQP